MENENNNINLTSSRIKQMRLDNGLTQKDLAKKLGLKNDTAIANYEAGYSTPKDDIKIKMCEEFGCSMDYLMGLTSHKNPKEELEKRLYKFNLTEDEYYDAINYFMNNDIQTLSFMLLFSSGETTQTKKYDVLLAILSYVSDYIADTKIPNNKSSLDPLVKVNFERELERAYRPAKRLLLSLDKSKIIHNYSEPITSKNWINKDLYEKEMHLNSHISYKEKYYMCPVYGQIPAGEPNWAEECIEGKLPIDPNMMNIVDPEECYFLRVNGESMNKVIANGAYALIRKTDWVENGEIAVVLVNGYDATLKKFTKQGDLIILEPISTDPSIQTQVYDKNTSINVIGKYIGKFELKN